MALLDQAVKAQDLLNNSILVFRAEEKPENNFLYYLEKELTDDSLE